MKNILMVCLGNICRSPMAEGWLKHYSDQHALGLDVRSAGLTAVVGGLADPYAIDVMQAKGIDIRQHCPRQLTSAMLHENDLILVMDSRQQQEIGYISPSVYGKVHRIGRWSGFDIPDPYRKPFSAFEESFHLIEQGLQDWQKKLWTEHV